MKQIAWSVLAIAARSRSHFHASFRHFRTMKQIQVESISGVETIKPSNPTPHHLRRHNLSFFEQLEPSLYMNTIIYFSNDPSKTKSHVTKTLKTSLAEILSIYYPLAGRIADNNLYIDCHDEGAHYRETNIKGSLSEIMSELDPSELDKFVPYDHTDSISAVGRLPLLVVQANFFECGGLVIGVLMYHKAGDALSFFTFLKNWASVARHDDDKVHFTLPDLGLASKLFPSVDLTGLKLMNYAMAKEERVSRRFVFSNDTLLNLCKKHEELERRPSRIEALSAFIWKRYIASTQIVQPDKNYRFILAVNLRTRFDPPLPSSVFGSVADMVVATDTSPEEDDCTKLIKNIRTSLSELSDPETLKMYQNGVQLLPMIEEAQEWMDNTENEVWILFTSACRILPAREMDFGWGPPLDVQVCLHKMCGKNMVTFSDTVDGNGVQVWVSFNKKDMAKFEVDPELLAHAIQT